MTTRAVLFGFLLTLSCSAARAASVPGPDAPGASHACPRPSAGGPLAQAPDLFSSNGILRLKLTYQSRIDQDENPVYCFTTERGEQSPTLHIKPGDELLISVSNMVVVPPPQNRRRRMSARMAEPPDFIVASSSGPAVCGASVMTDTSVNIHYHGTNASPRCGQDEVIKTLINSGQTFEYDVHIPADEPPGLYWYHPHVHGLAEAAVLGGASGAMIVEGLETVNHDVAGLPYRTLIFRDSLPADMQAPGGEIPSWDLSLNYSPIMYPDYLPPVLSIKPGEKQLWRVANAAADSILDLQLQYDGKVQPLHIVGLDGVPTGSQDDNSRGTTIVAQHVELLPAQRAEFIVTGPASTVKTAQLLTKEVDTGMDGDSDPARPLLTIVPDEHAPEPVLSFAKIAGPPSFPERFKGLGSAKVDRSRQLYFSEVVSDPSNPLSPTNFYITVAGAVPELFSPENPPAIVTTQGSVEDWTIQNTSLEIHAFHIHQIHFLVLEEDGMPVNGQYHDTVKVPAWSGSGPFPSVKVRMDFRGPDVGDFVYHCHILGHEDNGMMAIIRVQPRE